MKTFYDKCYLFKFSLIVWLLCFSLPSQSEDLIFYSYHNKPPYFLTGQTNKDNSSHDIYSAFISYLNQKQDQLRISLQFQPRMRLEEKLNKNQLDGAIIGVNPLWFKDKSMTKYLWSAPFMQDKDVVITPKAAKFIYHKPEDLIGKRMTLSRGLYYFGVSELIRQNKIQTYETNSDNINLEMLVKGRADASITSLLTFLYLSKSHTDFNQLEASKIPHDTFSRSILFPKKHRKAFNILQEIIARSEYDTEWSAILKNFGYVKGFIKP